MTRIFIVGDSHAGAIKRGCSWWRAAIHQIKFLPVGGGHVVRREFFSVDMANRRVSVRGTQRRRFHLPAAHGRLDFYAVSLPLNTSRILRDFDWRVYVPWYMVENPAEIPLSNEAIRRLIGSDADRAIAFVMALADIGLEVAVVEAPTFFEDADYLKDRRMDVCQEIVKLYRNYVLERLCEKQIRVIFQPADTLTPLGTTRMIYNHDDPLDVHHANAKFGALILDEIISLAKTRAPTFKQQARVLLWRFRGALRRIGTQTASLLRLA